jgi:hypothetical protein
MWIDPLSARLHWSIVIVSIAGEARVTTNPPPADKFPRIDTEFREGPTTDGADGTDLELNADSRYV